MKDIKTLKKASPTYKLSIKFRCPKCETLIEHSDMGWNLKPSFLQKGVPYEADCPNPKCKEKFLVEDNYNEK